MKSFENYQKLQKLVSEIRQTEYWDTLATNQYVESFNFGEGTIVELADIIEFIELPQIIRNSFNENDRLVFSKSFKISTWRSKEIFFEFQNPFSHIEKILQSIANAPTEADAELAMYELMTECLTVKIELI